MSGNIKGIFYGVSTGPGDPELMTVKAVRILKKADVIAAARVMGKQETALEIAKQAVGLDDKEILSLPGQEYIQEGHSAPHWLKHGSRPHGLDELVPTKKLLAAEMEKLSPAQADEMERMKQQVSADKAALSRKLNALDSQVQQAQAELEAVTGDRLQRLALQKKVTKLRQEYMKRQENQFFDAMRLDMELEEKIKAFAEKEKLTAKVQREFIVAVRRDV